LFRFFFFQFSIAAINDTESTEKWEPLAPSKEAQVFFWFRASFFSIWYKEVRLAHCWKIYWTVFFFKLPSSGVSSVTNISWWSSQAAS